LGQIFGKANRGDNQPGEPINQLRAIPNGWSAILPLSGKVRVVRDSTRIRGRDCPTAENLNTSRSVPCGTLTAERIVPHTVQGVGPITALTWALEMDDVSRFRSIDKAITYCGLCSDDGDAVPRRSGQNPACKRMGVASSSESAMAKSSDGHCSLVSVAPNRPNRSCRRSSFRTFPGSTTFGGSLATCAADGEAASQSTLSHPGVAK